MNIYLDIEGVLLTKDLRPAWRARVFIKYLVENYPVYWLTTHCQGKGQDPVPIMAIFLGKEAVEDLVKIKPAYWDTLKTEAIDFSQPFRWFEDRPLEAEIEVLREKGAFDSWVQIDLTKNPYQLGEYVASAIDSTDQHKDNKRRI